MRRVVIVNDKMQQGYRYELSASVGRDFDPQFRPDLTPKQMLELGVFCGKYLTDCRDEYPARWFARAKLSPSGRDCSLNYFGVDASQPLSEWRRKGWMHADDPRGWFQWYCRYYMGPQSRGGVLRFRDIERRVWGNAACSQRMALRRVIQSLRRKLTGRSNEKLLLKAEPRVGYRLVLGNTD
jgi:hypothetical protein